jgi:hypothetical protein
MWTIGCRLAPTVEAMVGINSLHVRPTANRFLSAPPDSKNDPKPGESRNSGCSLFPSLFLLCYLLLQKSAKSLTSLLRGSSLNRVPVFQENLPVSGKKQGFPLALPLFHCDGPRGGGPGTAAR